MKSPAEIAAFTSDVGVVKSKLGIPRMIALGFLAGFFIALAGAASNTASALISNASVAKIISGCVFPAGLTMVLCAGSELFTGNSLMAVALLDKRIKLRHMLKNWLFVYVGNYVGSVLAAALLSLSGQFGMFGGKVALTTVTAAANKCALGFGQAFVLGILCNVLVCVALLSRRHGVLVDCGSSNSYISAGDVAADHLLSAGIRRLDAVVLTHYHADHANGLALLLARVGVDTLYLPDIAEEDGEKSEVLALSERYGVEVRYVTEETQTAVGEASLTLYPPVGEGGENELGLTILCSAGDFDTLITGDMDSRTERVLVSSYPLPDIEVLLVGHHGSRYSTSEELLETVTPEVGVVSVGSNSYGHPTRDALLRLTDAGVTVYRTDLQGNIYITVN